MNGLLPTDEEYGDMLIEPIPDVDDVETYEKYLNAEFVIDRGDGPIRARVAKRAHNDNDVSRQIAQESNV
jgi:hypothetical protein